MGLENKICRLQPHFFEIILSAFYHLKKGYLEIINTSAQLNY